MWPSSVRCSISSRSKSAAPPKTGADPVFGGAADFDLELIESRTLDGHIQELIYRPALHAQARS